MKKVVRKLRQEVEVKVDIVTSFRYEGRYAYSWN